MPTLNEAIGTDPVVIPVVDATHECASTDQISTGVVDATIIPIPESTPTPTVPKTKKTKTPIANTPDSEKPAKSPKPKKESADGDVKEPKLIKPPMEQIAKDIEHVILDADIAGHKIKKLGYKCGKIIYGLPGTDGSKDFRIIALKARKKTKSVEGKSRCIFYFGIDTDHSSILKSIPGTHSTTFGKCSVQCKKKPIELVLDKVSFKDTFNQDSDKVVDAITKLVKLTIDHKTELYKELQEKTKTKTADTKPKKTAKSE